MKFDWYQASIPQVCPELVMSTLAASEYYGQWEEMKPLKGYDIGARFVLGDQTLFRINHGGQNKEHGANVLATGSSAPKLAEVVREHFPVHRVSRMDSCEDYHHRDAYSYLRRKALKVARDNQLQVREIIKPLKESDDGRTLYLGSPKSDIQARIYEKGKQLDCGTEWVRVELEISPKKKVKDLAAYLSPVEAWGLAKWSHALAQQLGKTSLQRVDAQVYQKSDDDRAYHFMLKQYGPLLQRRKAQHGSWDTLGAQIGLDLEELLKEQPKASLKLVK